MLKLRAGAWGPIDGPRVKIEPDDRACPLIEDKK